MTQAKHLFTLLLLSLLAWPSARATTGAISIGLFGDMPYSQWERQQLPSLLTDMSNENLAFVVHIGDIKNGYSVCSDAVFKDILGVFQASKTPLVYVPGDNEWTDCHRRNNGSFDPLERLDKLRELFFTGDTALGQRTMHLVRQSHDPAFTQYRENVRWEAGGALFVGLNLPGSKNNYAGSTGGAGPVPEFVQRSAANRVWLAQAFAQARANRRVGIMVLIQADPEFDEANKGRGHPGFQEFLTQLREETQTFAGQVVLVHGDSHHHQINQPMIDPTTGKVVKNFTRVETFGFPFFGWVKARVDATDPQVFQFEPRPWNRDSHPN